MRKAAVVSLVLKLLLVIKLFFTSCCYGMQEQKWKRRRIFEIVFGFIVPLRVWFLIDRSGRK